jgi:phenylpropionate dioxygenase-like ring-hydroxylating dioxygenase large terminal subunit
MLDGIRDHWYAILPAEELGHTEPLALRRLGEDLVLWRDSTGRPRLFADRCPHRSSPLSLGSIDGDRLECWYHGLQFGGDGACRRVPVERRDDGPLCGELRARAYPCEERGEYLWGYLTDGDVDVVPRLELEPEVTSDDYLWFRTSLRYEADWLTVLENALDPGHVPFLHGDAPFLPDDANQTLDWFLPSRVTSRTEEVPSPSGEGVRTAVLQVATRPSGGDEVELFYPPNLNKIPVPLPDGGEPMWSIHYHTPIDASTTMGYWYLCRRVCNDDERDRWRSMWETFVGPATERVYEQDGQICAAQVRRRGTAGAGRGEERWLPQDGGFLRARRLLVEMHRSAGR